MTRANPEPPTIYSARKTDMVLTINYKRHALEATEHPPGQFKQTDSSSASFGTSYYWSGTIRLRESFEIGNDGDLIRLTDAAKNKSIDQASYPALTNVEIVPTGIFDDANEITILFNQFNPTAEDSKIASDFIKRFFEEFINILETTVPTTENAAGIALTECSKIFEEELKKP